MDGLEVVHHVVDLQSVDRGVIPAATVRGLLAAALPEHCHQVLIGAAATCQAAGSIIEGLIILNPEGHVPGLPVCPSVESGSGHRFRSVWYVRILQGQGGGLVPPLCQCLSRPSPSLPSGCCRRSGSSLRQCPCQRCDNQLPGRARRFGWCSIVPQSG